MRVVALVLLLMLMLAACAGGPDGVGTPSSAPPGPTAVTSSTAVEPSPAGTATQTPSPTADVPAPGTVPPSWLGTRELPEDATGLTTPPALRNRRFTLPDALPALPGKGFRAKVSDPAPPEVIARSTWHASCPVAADELAWLRLTFRGFDGDRHTGELLVHSSAADDLVQVFRDLWRADFPMEQMTITTAEELDAAPTGDGNNTGAFTCRPVTGGTTFSEHASGLAVDINPFQNPYVKGGVVLPELATSYLDRDRIRAGMITADGPVVRAFARIGWGWGGSWRTLKDLHHFSANNR